MCVCVCVCIHIYVYTYKTIGDMLQPTIHLSLVFWVSPNFDSFDIYVVPRSISMQQQREIIFVINKLKNDILPWVAIWDH